MCEHYWICSVWSDPLSLTSAIMIFSISIPRVYVCWTFLTVVVKNKHRVTMGQKDTCFNLTVADSEWWHDPPVQTACWGRARRRLTRSFGCWSDSSCATEGRPLPAWLLPSGTPHGTSASTSGAGYREPRRAGRVCCGGVVCVCVYEKRGGVSGQLWCVRVCVLERGVERFNASVILSVYQPHSLNHELWGIISNITAGPGVISSGNSYEPNKLSGILN